MKYQFFHKKVSIFLTNITVKCFLDEGQILQKLLYTRKAHFGVDYIYMGTKDAYHAVRLTGQR